MESYFTKYPYRNVFELACTISEERSNHMKKTLEMSQKLQILRRTCCIGENYSRELLPENKTNQIDRRFSIHEGNRPKKIMKLLKVIYGPNLSKKGMENTKKMQFTFLVNQHA